MGVANNRSIAWGAAQSLASEGAQLIFTYENERVAERVLKLVDTIPGAIACPCNVQSEEELDSLAVFLKEKVGVLHGYVHSIAYARPEDLDGLYVDTSREGYTLAQEISAYSLASVSRRIYPLMTEGGSIATLTYIGAERAIKYYNVMGVAKAALEASVRYLANDLGDYGIRVNAISAGPIRTLAAYGIKDFNAMLKQIEEITPLRKTVDTSEVGDTALFLMSRLSRGITGEVIHVDAGYHITAM
ncbi:MULTISPECIES: enoyl-ACP reductase FabI [Paenibacillus]|uniref:enoyl-ACP reductase FabI n=1 Tax=Paenibacillus TaxID=44249 RepID=UPI0022B8D652|nr:SDR family oxidoreductase [Paenibacillus caseinilyticus]MCZ8520307.1 SDR family oxidoreductase [Paenibacillus caseinilyticus]